jgi:anti-sigma regulatory factor (Ser/Thr protein kinase)
LIYERVVPAVPASVGRIRAELADALAEHGLLERGPDIAIVVGEAVTNAVVHAYVGRHTGPIYAVATLAQGSLMVSVADCGRGIRAHRDRRGLGLGLPLMRRLTDELELSSNASDPCRSGTCIHAIFERAGPTERALPERHPVTGSVIERSELLVEYLRVLAATADGLRRDANALVAEAQQIVARVKRQRQERADRR